VDKIDDLSVNTLRNLSIDMINKAKSGHPGFPLGASAMAYVLWTKHLKVNPNTHMNWINRDRFVLSSGHGSALLYSLLHLSGYDLSVDDLKNFRQLNSNTPGHPEYGKTDGVEATTGPLGQGFGMAVGMAMAEAHLSKIYNRPNFPIIDHYTYTILGDGDLMEGISHEAASLAGHLKLGKLIVLYDSNDISLDGSTSLSVTNNIREEYNSYGWQYLLVKNGNNLEDIDVAIDTAKKNVNQPTIIEIKTTIGYGAPEQGTNKMHGTPLNEKDLLKLKENLNWEYPEFTVPREVKIRFNNTIIQRGMVSENKWNDTISKYKNEYPSLYKEFKRAFNFVIPNKLKLNLPVYENDKSISTRDASSNAISSIARAVSSFWGGSADLATSNKTLINNSKSFQSDSYEGRNIYFGVREFQMAAAMNGIALHGGTIVYGGTFFAFSDYLKAAIRLSAMQKLPVIYVLTHDSIAVGEDGATHEPIEQLAALRCIPNIQVFRPADGNETSSAWNAAIETRDKPTVLVLSRQSLPIVSNKLSENISRGGSVLINSKKKYPDGILIATGSEVHLAIQAHDRLIKMGIDTLVVSMPSLETFMHQDKGYKDKVLPPLIKNRITIEAASTFGWSSISGDKGISIGINDFGESAPNKLIFEKYGLTVNHIVEKFIKMMNNNS